MRAALAAQAVAPGTGQDVGYDPAELAHRLRLDILPVLDFLESQDQLPAIFQPEVAKESLMADHRLSLLPFYRGWGTYNEMEAFHLRLVVANRTFVRYTCFMKVRGLFMNIMVARLLVFQGDEC